MARRGLLRTLNARFLRRRLISLMRSPLFWWITLAGNASIFGGACLFYIFESKANPAVGGFLDCLTWAVGIVTTVGSGAIQPVTALGKVLSLFMMMGGAVFLWSYMALFVGFLVDPELTRIERELSEIQHDVREEAQRLKPS